MADMLLDITLFDDLRRGDVEARKVIEGILDGEVAAAISPMTVCELWHRGGIDRRAEIGFLSVLRFVEEIAPNIDAARTAGLWLADSDLSSGRDAACVAVAAATAKQLDIPICTRDLDSFNRFDVEITTY